MIQYLSNTDLEKSFSAVVVSERKILHQVLEHIAEIDRRKLFLKLGSSSLFQFLTQKYKYSPAAAQRRIEAARLLKSLPVLSSKIESGSLNLSQIGELQRACKQVPVEMNQKLELLEKIENKTVPQTQVILKRALDIPVIEKESVKSQKDESKRLELTLSKEQFEKLEKVRGLMASKFINPKISNVFEELCDLYLERKLGVPRQRTTATATAVRRAVLNRDQVCQYKDKQGRMCGSRFNLNIDHIQSKWAGGTDEIKNLQILCRAHNQHKYKLEAGFR